MHVVTPGTRCHTAGTYRLHPIGTPTLRIGEIVGFRIAIAAAGDIAAAASFAGKMHTQGLACKNNRLVTIQQYPMLGMPAHRTIKHNRFNVAT
jgi:hypothetical protein